MAAQWKGRYDPAGSYDIDDVVFFEDVAFRPASGSPCAGGSFRSTKDANTSAPLKASGALEDGWDIFIRGGQQFLEPLRFRGDWNSGDTYARNNAVALKHAIYVALRDVGPSGVVPPNDPTSWYRLVSYLGSMVWRGVWDASTQYEIDDIVKLGEKTFVAYRRPPKGEAPADPSDYWRAAGMVNDPAALFTWSFILNGVGGSATLINAIVKTVIGCTLSDIDDALKAANVASAAITAMQDGVRALNQAFDQLQDTLDDIAQNCRDATDATDEIAGVLDDVRGLRLGLGHQAQFANEAGNELNDIEAVNRNVPRGQIEEIESEARVLRAKFETLLERLGQLEQI